MTQCQYGIGLGQAWCPGVFFLNISLPPRSEQVNGIVTNEIKHDHSPELIVVLDPRYN